jgi:nucleotide-binding universal stress UspA family protein
MKHVRKILVPIDFSASAANAFKFAQKLAKKFGAKLKVINIYRADFGMPVPETMAYQMLEARKAEALKKMENFLKTADIELKIENVVELGYPSDMIVDYTKIKEEKIDLIIMGTKGEHNLAERILGSVSTAVIRDALCPVLVVPENCKELEIKKIAYASDLKKDTAESIGEAAKIAKLFDATLHFVYVDTNGDSSGEEKQKFKELISKLHVDINLTELKSDTVDHGLDSYVHEEGVDLLLMYRPHRTLFERIFHNSATKKVALHSTVPLLVFKKQ